MRHICKIPRPLNKFRRHVYAIERNVTVTHPEWLLCRNIFNSWTLLTISEVKTVPVLDVKAYGGLK